MNIMEKNIEEYVLSLPFESLDIEESDIKLLNSAGYHTMSELLPLSDEKIKTYILEIYQNVLKKLVCLKNIKTYLKILKVLIYLCMKATIILLISY